MSFNQELSTNIHFEQQSLLEARQEERRRIIFNNLEDDNLYGIKKKTLEKKIKESKATILSIMGLPLSAKTGTSISLMSKFGGEFFPWASWVLRHTNGDVARFGKLGNQFSDVSESMWNDIDTRLRSRQEDQLFCIEFPAGTDVDTYSSDYAPIMRGSNIINKLRHIDEFYCIAIYADEKIRQEKILIKEKAHLLLSQILSAKIIPQRAYEELTHFAELHGVEIKYEGNPDKLVEFYCQTGASPFAIRGIDAHIDHIIRFMGTQQILDVDRDFYVDDLREKNLEDYCELRTPLLGEFWATYLEGKNIPRHRRCIFKNPLMQNVRVLHDLDIVSAHNPYFQD